MTGIVLADGTDQRTDALPSRDDRSCLTVSVTTAAALLGISRSYAYKLCASRDLPSVKVGRRLVVPKTAIAALLAGAEHHDD